MDKNILRQLKSEYEEREIKPSADLWGHIDDALEKQSESAQKTSFSFGWWKYAAVVLLLISVGTLIYYNSDFNVEKTDYLVKRNLEKTTVKNEDNSLVIHQEENQITDHVPEVVKETTQKVKENIVQNLKPKIETLKYTFLKAPETKIVIIQPEKQIDNPENIDSKITPIISDTKKISYVSANDLLMGRELDKSRENANKDKRNFGVIHINRVLPNFGHVTVLGVSVYVDPK